MSSSNHSHSTEGVSPQQNPLDRPPYTPPSSSDNKQVKYTGSCFCKTVQFEIYRESPLDSKYCHCRACQTLHGAPFQWASIFEKTDVYFTQGKEKLVYWNTGEKKQDYHLPCKVACGVCRAPIMDEGRNMLLLFPTLIDFKDGEGREKFRPSCHIFYSRRAVDVIDGIPKWDGHKDESKQLPESVRLPGHSVSPAEEEKL